MWLQDATLGTQATSALPPLHHHRLNKTYAGAVKEGEETIYSIYGPKKEIIITKNKFSFQKFKEYYPLDIQLKKLDKVYEDIIKKGMEGLSKFKV